MGLDKLRGEFVTSPPFVKLLNAQGTSNAILNTNKATFVIKFTHTPRPENGGKIPLSRSHEPKPPHFDIFQITYKRKTKQTETLHLFNLNGRRWPSNKRAERGREAFGGKVGGRHSLKEPGPPHSWRAVALQQDIRVQLLNSRAAMSHADDLRHWPSDGAWFRRTLPQVALLRSRRSLSRPRS